MIQTISRLIVLVTIILATSTVPAQNVSIDNVEIPAAIDGRTERVIRHMGYTVSYNSDWKIPNWVAYELTAEEVSGETPRANKFVPDPMVPKYESATTKDYTNSGYDRGHMAPAGDMKWHHQAMRESFYLSNVCPQNHNLNNGAWKYLEEMVRDLATQKGRIFVVCGPIVSDDSHTIGINNVVVPQAFFKVLLQENNGEIHTIGFIYENKRGNNFIVSYARTVDEVEEAAGIDFFPSLPDNIEERAESEVDFTQWTVKSK